MGQLSLADQSIVGPKRHPATGSDDGLRRGQADAPSTSPAAGVDSDGVAVRIPANQHGALGQVVEVVVGGLEVLITRLLSLGG